MTSANRDGALVPKDPIRLYLSGGGNRAALGGVGAIAALVDADEWQHVGEVVSVSGGSFPNAVLLTPASADVSTQPGRDHDDPLPSVCAMARRLLDDRMRPFATRRRGLAVLAGTGVIVLAVATVLIAIGVGPWSLPNWIALLVGLLVIPVMLLVLRRLAALIFRDMVTTIIGPNAPCDLAATTSPRQHLFCAAGLSSGVPYTLWAGESAPAVTWGECLRSGYTVSDAVAASGALPGLASITAPPSLDRELLVDGGVIGIFGQQTHEWIRRRAGQVHRGDIRQCSIDAGRHAADDGSFGRRLTRLSIIYALGRWLKVSLEGTYVNDLDDARGDTLIRLCWDRSMPPTEGTLGPALDALAQCTSRLGLFDLGTDRAPAALASGYARTLIAVRPKVTKGEIAAGLDRLGQRLEVDLGEVWDRALGAARTAAPADSPVHSPVETN